MSKLAEFALPWPGGDVRRFVLASDALAIEAERDELKARVEELERLTALLPAADPYEALVNLIRQCSDATIGWNETQQQLADANAARERVEQAAKNYRRFLATLREYARHAEGCSAGVEAGRRCRCGFDEALRNEQARPANLDTTPKAEQ